MAFQPFSPPRPRRPLGGFAAVAALVTLVALVGRPTAGADVVAALVGTTTTTTTPPPPGPIPGYWLVASDGGVFAFGGLPFYGSMGGRTLNRPMVGMAATSDGKGYWMVASDGGVFSFGDAAFHGSMGAVQLNQPVVGMTGDPATGGYWMVAADGGIFAFGAPFYGSLGHTPLNKPVVGMAATPDGRGYWLFASDGGIFAFGDAQYHGSMGGTALSAPIVGAAAPDVGGYWMVAADGGIFTFGDAQYYGSLGGHALSRPIAAMAEADPKGYWTTDTNGAVTAFGDAAYAGSAPQQLSAPIVGMTEGPGNGDANGNGIYPSGSYGYDVSKFNDNYNGNPPPCDGQLPSGHTIGVVQVTGYGPGAPNPCLAHEAQWAGAGLDLYVYMIGGTQTAAEPGCKNDPACNYGYSTILSAFDTAATAGVNTYVTWWLDVEPDPSWSSDTSANASVVRGAIYAVRDKGINNLGIYTSPDSWNQIVGNYRPAVPLWVAWYSGNGGPYNCQNIASYAATHQDLLPTGPVWLTQYTNNAATQSSGQTVDGDYAC
ncbi:MAG: glycoside hydrolase family 25 domain-containing protein [Acidimicrobiales bacterium]